MAGLGTLSSICFASRKNALQCNRWALVFQHYRQNHCRFKSSSSSSSLSHLTCNVTKTTLRHRATSAEFSPDSIAHPPPPGIDKQYPTKIKNIVDDIAKLTLIEVADLNELLKKTLNIQDSPMMAMGTVPMAQPQAQAAEEEAETTSKKVQTAFVVKLEKFDETKKVPLIKEIKNNVEGMNLVQAKKFVESAPQIVKADLTKEEAEKLKAALEAVGATITLV